MFVHHCLQLANKKYNMKHYFVQNKLIVDGVDLVVFFENDKLIISVIDL